MGNLKGKRALVTGGGQGLGYAITEHLLDAGADVAIHYFSSQAGAQELKTRAAKLGCRAEGFRADLTRETEAGRLVQQSAAFLGGLDVLINNAGDLVGRHLLQEMEADFWAKVMTVNLTSMMYVTRAALPWLLKAGQASIVNLSSLAGRRGGHQGSLAYSTAKGGVLTWTRALAVELGPKGVRVNAVAPGLILGTRFHATHTTEASAQETIRHIPLGRAGTPADVARAVVYVASEYDGFITGATLDINGGVYSA
ncbi:MAG TPA: SDR family NAD(P)-dependent oxidoreductase [Candidatus Acidoferrum sp.]|nr:SDR family NAD(P)-dependent oxidoreductase [Candidatus Acidoferrum sp.]